MNRHVFHLSAAASSPLYHFIASPRIRLAILCINFLAILLFSLGVGLGKKYIPLDNIWDTSLDNFFPEVLALGVMFMPFVWLVFLLNWHLLKRPLIHPGYYVGFDLYIALSILTALGTVINLSAPVLHIDRSPCAYSSESGAGPTYSSCMQHITSIQNLDIVAYALGYLVALLLSILFCIDCHVCRLYNKEKAIKLVQKHGVRMGSSSRPDSSERIVRPANHLTMLV